MFNKSMIENQKKEPPEIGRLLFNGYVEVRTAPTNPPRDLKERLKKGADVIKLWFYHVHADEFRQFNDQHVKLTSLTARRSKILPTIDEITSTGLLEFCKSINVHPAHLVPMDDDIEMTLPTPLLELLIDMAYGNMSKELSVHDVHLASTAIYYECKRVKHLLKSEKRQAFQNGERFSTLASVFADVLGDPTMVQAMRKTTRVTPTNTFAAEAGRSYPYIDRVMDLAIHQSERVLDASNNRLSLKRQILHVHVEAFVKTYKKTVHGGWNCDIDARDFLMDILDVVAERNYRDQDDIKCLVEDMLQDHAPIALQHEVASDIYQSYFTANEQFRETGGQLYLTQLEEGRFLELISAVQAVVIASNGSAKAKQKHEQEEGRYIGGTAKISAAFDEIDDPQMRNLLNNRALLSLHNIGVDNKVTAQLSPK